jgi:two-component system, chemotaxis family, chemotaxis protein CheY
MNEPSSNDSRKRILLVGHCGPDGSYLRGAVKAALGDVQFLQAEDNAQMEKIVEGGVDLILFNRDLGYGFEPATGVDMIASLRQQHPALRMMLVSNYPDAQAAAVAAGALTGFGKRQIGTPRVTQVLRDALTQAKS